MFTWFGNSVVIGVFVTVLTVTVNLLAGYAFARLRFRGRNAVFLLALATMMIPLQAIMVAQFKLVAGLGIYGTYWGVILPAPRRLSASSSRGSSSSASPTSSSRRRASTAPGTSGSSCRSCCRCASRSSRC